MDSLDTKIETLKKDSNTVRREVRKQSLSYITAAFGLVAGLAWNEAIKGLIQFLFPASANSLIAQFVYAIGMTVLVVVVSVYLVRIFKKEHEA